MAHPVSRREQSQERILPVQFAPLRWAYPVLDRAGCRPSARPDETHESPTRHQRGADPRHEAAHLITRQSGNLEGFHTFFCIFEAVKRIASRCNVARRRCATRPGACDSYRKQNTTAMAKVVKVIELMSQLPQKPCRTFARLYQEFSAEVDNS